MIIIGIDPGTATTGYGVIRCQGNRFEPLEHGCIKTPAGLALADRMQLLYQELSQLLVKWQPDFVAVEELFFNRNVRTAVSVAQARGVILLCAAQQGLAVSEYTPPQVKSAVTGYGKADKKQMQYMVKTLLNLDKIPRPDDAADALAVAICHVNYGLQLA